jgi:steroid 5-alpha reductase family enzyme
MEKADRNELIALPVVIVPALGIAMAGSQGGTAVFGTPIFALVVTVVLVIQWVGFIAACLLQTERFYDLTVSFTYFSVTIMALLLSPTVDGRSIQLLILVILWAGRLGTFLFRRILKAGKFVYAFLTREK